MNWSRLEGVMVLKAVLLPIRNALKLQSMPVPTRRLRVLTFGRFAASESGNVALLAALFAVPLLALAGGVVDFANGFQQREVVQRALDAAAVGASRLSGLEPEHKIRAEAEAIFAANISRKLESQVSVTTVVEPGAVMTTATLTLDNAFLGIVGVEQQTYNMSARAVTGNAIFEVAMVLDNSGSMRGQKIAALREAADDLVDVLFDANVHNPLPDPVKIALVPFSRAVNVGPANANAAWLDTSGHGTYHHENFDEDTSRLDLFEQIRGVTWQGCVEARPHPEDVRDTPPTLGQPATLIVPYFAPDEPDYTYYYSNSYLPDDGGRCRSAYGLNSPQRQQRVCKYDGARMSGNHNNGISWGPNFGCTSRPLAELTTVRADIDANIRAMGASGMTNIHAGVMWGWRALSPGEPLTNGRAYDHPDNHKLMIVMSDGANTYTSRRNYNRSDYGAYGHIRRNRLGTTSTRNSTVIGRMNGRTLEACNNAKLAGIRIYTVAFQVASASTRELLVNCASDPELAYESDTNAELVATFRQIGQDITALRLER